MYFPKISFLVTLSTFAILLTLTVAAETPSCAQNLVPCTEYLNATNPPSSCCDPLKEAVEKQMKCLCDLYNTPGLLQGIGINITDALSLPSRCKLTGDLNSCVKASGPSSSSPSPPASPGKDKSGVSKITGTGTLSILSFLLYAVIF